MMNEHDQLLQNFIKPCFVGVYSYFCGRVLGTVEAGGSPSVAPDTMRDLERVLMEDLGMTEQDVLDLRSSASSGRIR